jgi:hypothetical protein
MKEPEARRNVQLTDIVRVGQDKKSFGNGRPAVECLATDGVAYSDFVRDGCNVSEISCKHAAGTAFAVCGPNSYCATQAAKLLWRELTDPNYPDLRLNRPHRSCRRHERDCPEWHKRLLPNAGAHPWARPGDRRNAEPFRRRAGTHEHRHGSRDNQCKPCLRGGRDRWPLQPDRIVARVGERPH